MSDTIEKVDVTVASPGRNYVTRRVPTADRIVGLGDGTVNDDAVRLLAEHPEIATVITHVLPAQEAGEAFGVAKDGAQSRKIVVSLWRD